MFIYSTVMTELIILVIQITWEIELRNTIVDMVRNI